MPCPLASWALGRGPRRVLAAAAPRRASGDQRQAGVGRWEMTHLLQLVSASARAQDVGAVSRKKLSWHEEDFVLNYHDGERAGTQVQTLQDQGKQPRREGGAQGADSYWEETEAG